MHMLFRRNFQRHGFQTNIYACGVDLFNKPSGILGAGEFFLKIVKAKAIVDTLASKCRPVHGPALQCRWSGSLPPRQHSQQTAPQDRRRSQQDHTSLSATSFGFFHQKPGRAAVLARSPWDLSQVRPRGSSARGGRRNRLDTAPCPLRVRRFTPSMDKGGSANESRR